MKRWRLERQRRGTGLVRLLRTGSGSNRRTVSLGTLPDEDAQAMLATLRDIESAELGASWLAWHERDSRAAVRILRHPDAIEETRRLSRDWPSTRLRAYYSEVYAPWRSRARKSWPAERSHWVRILRELGDLRIDQIDPWVVADFLDAARVERPGRKGQALSGNTKRLWRAAITALLKRAHRLRHLEQVPDLATFPIEGSTRRKEPTAPLNAEETRRLLRAARTTQHRALFAVAIGQGLRPSELKRMQWDDIDWSVPDMLVRGTKTEDARARIPLTPVALPWLRTHWHEREQPTEGPVFVTASGQAYQSVTGYRRALATAAERAEIDRPVTPYLLRASFVTLAWEMGLAEDVVQRITRHTSPRMIREVYNRPSPAQLARRVAGFRLDD